MSDQARVAASLRAVADRLESFGVTREVKQTIDRELLHGPEHTPGWLAQRYTELVYGCLPPTGYSGESAGKLVDSTEPALPDTDRQFRGELRATLAILGGIMGATPREDPGKDIRCLRACASALAPPVDVKAGATEPVCQSVALTPEARTILEALANEYPMTVTQEDMAGQTRLTERTVGKYLRQLRDADGFVGQPCGPKKGFAITPKGLAAIGHK